MPELDLDLCRARRQRLLDAASALGADWTLLGQTEHVQWLTGYRAPWTMQTAAVLFSDGKTLLIAPQKTPDRAAVDDVATYEAKRHSTLRNDQRAALAAVLTKAVAGRPKPKRIAVEFSNAGRHFDPLGGEPIDIEPTMYRLRRRKDPDEMAMIETAVAATDAMYAAAREMIAPGVNELDVFNRLQAAAVRSFGEMLTGTGNDYQCGSRGGAPRDRVAQAGELYILDLGPAYRGYFADNCRAFAVDGRPTPVQQEAWSRIMSAFELIESKIRPGVSCKGVFEDVQRLLDQSPVGKFNHHLGHGIGLFPHETPHLNPFWDDMFEEGDVFTAEPGLYAPELKAGIRLENDYVVTASGVRRLGTFPLEL